MASKKITFIILMKSYLLISNVFNLEFFNGCGKLNIGRLNKIAQYELFRKTSQQNL